eukprot:1763759-Amphidinium_carterae.2
MTAIFKTRRAQPRRMFPFCPKPCGHVGTVCTWANEEKQHQHETKLNHKNNPLKKPRHMQAHNLAGVRKKGEQNSAVDSKSHVRTMTKRS